MSGYEAREPISMGGRIETQALHAQIRIQRQFFDGVHRQGVAALNGLVVCGDCRAMAHTQRIVHTRLETLEAHQDAFFSLSAILSAFTLICIFILWLSAYLVRQRVVGTVSDLIDPFVFLSAYAALLWIVCQGNTKRMLFSSIGLAIALCVDTLVHLMPLAEFLGFNSPSLAGIAIVCLALCYVVFRVIALGHRLQRLSLEQRYILIPPGDVEGGTATFFRAMFRVPRVLRWLWGRQEAFARIMFSLAAFILCYYVGTCFLLFFAIFPFFVGHQLVSCSTSAEAGSPCLLLHWGLVAMIPFPIVGLALILLAGRALRVGARRLARISMQDLVKRDTRQPILFLRSFRDDQVKLRKPDTTLVGRIVWLAEPRPTLDHVLFEEGTPHGPVVAIGAPGSRQRFGAARAFVTDQDWHNAVSDLCNKAGAIILVVDETEGVRWEMGHVAANDHLNKTIFLVPPRLASSDQISTLLPVGFGGLRDWINSADKHRHCIGWFMRADGQVEVFSTPRNSQLSYMLVVRIFLSRHSGQDT
jgi:hypothetical protein